MPIPAMQHLPPWTVDYSYDVTPSVARTPSSLGFSQQSSRGNRRSTIADVTRRLCGAEISYFEWFVRGICNEGQSKFTDAYQDHRGNVTGTVRIVNGSYQVDSNLRFHTVTCQLEIFR